MDPIGRRTFLGGAVASGASLLLARRALGDSGHEAVHAEIEKRHDEAVKRLQTWIAQPSIAAENRGVAEGNELLREMLKDAGFQHIAKIPTDGQPGVFATLDARAARTVGLYFMYDVKQVKPEEWSSPPWEARLVDVPGVGKSVMGRGAVNQKGPQSALLAALHAIRGAGGKLPVNLVLVAEGEEEIGSPHFPQIVRRPEVLSALDQCRGGIFMPAAQQGLDGSVQITLGAKGVIELELISTAERWGRGAAKDIHSGNRARVDSPAFHLVQALATLVDKDGNPAIDNYADAARPLTAEELAMVDESARRQSEETAKKSMGIKVWARNADWRQSMIDSCSRPTVNIEGLVAGHTGPGGMTVLPHKAVAKIDMRLVPDMTAHGALAALKLHLEKRGFGDLEVNMSGGYDPSTTPAKAGLVRAAQAVYKRAGIDALLWPRSGGSWPGYVFTGAPLKLAAGHFGLGHGLRAHAPDEYYLIESSNPKLTGYDGAVKSFVDCLYELATVG